MTIKELAITKLKEYGNNPRINDNAVEAVANSIREFGFKVPIIIDKNNIIVAGHTRLRAAKSLGLEKVPCIIADDLTEEQVKAFRLADNKTAELAAWDYEKLDKELQGIGIDMLQFGFTADSDVMLEEDEDDEKYTRKINIPKYEPTGECPPVNELANTTKTDELIKEINEAKIPADVKRFLKTAATRHTVFDYSKIAEFYSHADKEVQNLMEKSALVIVDAEKAIEYGYMRLVDEFEILKDDGEDEA